MGLRYPKLPLTSSGRQAAKHELLTIGRPARVDFIGCSIRDSDRLSAVRVDDPNIPLSTAIAGECDAPAVRTEGRLYVCRRITRQLCDRHALHGLYLQTWVGAVARRRKD